MNAQATERVLVLGGAGFIGCNLVDRLVREGARVRVYDNLSRAGVRQNADWLREQHGEQVEIIIGDVRDRLGLRRACADVQAVFHLAAQVAVTTSLLEPLYDFEVNLRGTLEVLEALRGIGAPPPLVFTSTNKVYGELSDLELHDLHSRWEPKDGVLRERGIGESCPLNFCSPYGCSKGGADQYVLDYAQTFGLPAAVFRMSCIYGPHQFGTEDQGWVAHFLIRALSGQPITIYGDGKQVRDVLFIDDLVEALLLAWRQMSVLRGRAFNIGGGSRHTVSLRELIAMIGRLREGDVPKTRFAPWRPGDQRYYVSGIDAFSKLTGWQPRVDVETGVERLYRWLLAQPRPSGAAGAASRSERRRVAE